MRSPPPNPPTTASRSSPGRSNAAAASSSPPTPRACTPTSPASPPRLLRREHAELTERYADSKNTRGDEREREALERQRHQALAALDSASHRAQEADQLGDRPAAAREQAIADHANQRLHQLDAHIHGLNQREQNPSAPSEAELVRYAAITDELERRDRVQRLALVLDPPAHLTAALGSVPVGLDARERWQQTAGRIERYRDHYGITDPDRALGENPQDLRQRSDWRQLRHEIRHGRESITREADRGRELEL